MVSSQLLFAAVVASSLASSLLPNRIIDLGPTDLDGDWKIVRLTSHGVDRDPQIMGNIIYRIKGNKCQYMNNGVVVNDFKWTRDETLRPWTLDIEYIGDNPQTKQQYAGGVKAIYRMVDGKLERNYADPGQERPTEFKSTMDNGHTLILLERVAK